MASRFVCSVALLAALVALPSSAQEAPPHLVPQQEVMAASGAPGLALMASEFGVGSAAALLAVPVTLWAGSWLGSLSNNLVVAALPPVLLLAVLPPLAVSLTELLVGGALAPGRPRLTPAFWAALGAQVLAIAGGVALGLSSQNLGDVALFSLAEAVLLPAVVTLTLNTGAPAAAPPPAPAPPAPALARAPVAYPPALTVPLLAARF